MIENVNYHITTFPKGKKRFNYSPIGQIVIGVPSYFIKLYQGNIYKSKSFPDLNIEVYIFREFILIKSVTVVFESIYKEEVKSFIDDSLLELYEKETSFINYLKPFFHLNYLAIEKEKELNDLEKDINSIKKGLEDKEEKANSLRKYFEKINTFLHEKDKYTLDDNGNLLITVENITASDVSYKGEDIFLGDITFAVNFITKQIYVVSGSFKREAFSLNSYIPHQMSDRSICMGTFSVEFHACLEDFDIDVLKVLLTKYASTYDSSDSAGVYYTKWLDTNRINVRGGYYDYEDVIFCPSSCCYVPKEKAVFIESKKAYYSKQVTVFVPEINSYELISDCIYVDNIPYLKSGFVPLAYGGFIHYSKAVYCETLKGYYPKDLLINFKGEEKFLCDLSKSELEELGWNDFIPFNWLSDYTFSDNKGILYRFNYFYSDRIKASLLSTPSSTDYFFSEEDCSLTFI